jgi:hypothetical protein
MRKPVSEWPSKKNLSPAPVEELRKDLVAASVALATTEKKQQLWPYQPKEANGLRKAHRVTGYVLMAVAKWLKKESFRPIVKMEGNDKTRFSAPPLEFLRAAEQLMIKGAQADMKLNDKESLLPVQEAYTTVLGKEEKIWVVGSRSKSHFKVAYDREFLPIIDSGHPLAELYLEDAHSKDHGGRDSMVMRSRQTVWIVRAKKLAEKVKSRCFTCKILAKKTEGQVMAPLPAHRMGPAPVFYSTAVDLFGPLEYKGTVRGPPARATALYSCARPQA